MFEKTISKNAKSTLALLGEKGVLGYSYLAGGTALALQIGHRISYDLDFFTPKEFDGKILIQRLKKNLTDFQLERAEWQTIIGYIKKTRFSLFFYNYPLLFKTHKFLKINVADIRDIASMKIAAISGRGTKRDFIDLYFILKKARILTLKKVLSLYNKKFKVLEQNKTHLLKSLVYFNDAEKDPMPKMLREANWQEIKDFFEEEVKKISAELIQ